MTVYIDNIQVGCNYKSEYYKSEWIPSETTTKI